MSDAAINPMALPPASESAPEPTKRRWMKRLGWVIALIFVPILLGAAFLSSPIGKRFVADQIAALEPANGLRFRIGRIEGDIYGKATLRNVEVIDPKGVFLTVPEVVLDWRPLVFLWSGLDIREVTAQRGRLQRLPELLPGDPDAPILPEWDIRLDRLTIESLVIAEGIATDQAEKVNLTARIRIRQGRALINATGNFGANDRLALLLDAEPDGDKFDLGLDYVAPAGGVLGGLLGLEGGYVARLAGEGTWSDWRGHALARRWPAPGETDRRARSVAGFRITNKGGSFGVTGQVRPILDDGGIIARAVGDSVSLVSSFTLADSVLDGRAAVVTSALDLRGSGGVDLTKSRVDDVTARLVLRDPDLLGNNLRLENARLAAKISGPFSKLAIDHELTLERLVAGDVEIAGLTQRGLATYGEAGLTVPLAITAQRLVTGSEMIDPRLLQGRLDGVLTYDGGRLVADRARIAFPGVEAVLALRGDVPAGAYALAGPIAVKGMKVEGAGDVTANAKILAKFGPDLPWSLRANLAGVLTRIGNASIVNLAGAEIRFKAALGMGEGQPIVLRDAELASARLNARLDSKVVPGSDGTRATLAGSGRQQDYGAFTFDVELAGDGPRAVLVLADPYPAAALKDVRVALAPSGDGFAIDVAGGSLLGPFKGALGLVLPEGEPTRITIERLDVFRTTVTGALALRDSGVDGRFALRGGGITGDILLQPAAGGAQGFSVDLIARNARFGGDMPITIASADIRASGRFDDRGSFINGTVAGSGFEYGVLNIARLDAKAEITNGAGKVTGSIAGRRSDRFALAVDADVAPGRIAALLRGDYGGSAITMPRRAVLTSLDSGGWSVAPSQIGYGGGYAILEGQLGGSETAIKAQLAQMPLLALDLAGSELGFGGRMSGIATYRQRGVAPPTGSAKLRIDRFSRAGLVLSSQPVNLLAVADLAPDRLTAGVRLLENGKRLGQVKARITGLGAGSDLTARLMRGRLDADLAYDGPVEALWRLGGIETFDITGAASITAKATGTLSNPRIKGDVASDNLRVQSAVTGTDITNAVARGRFVGSRLEITRFVGSTQGNGSVTGSGTIDLAGMSAERGPKIDLRAAAKDARLLNANRLNARLTGPLRIVSDGVGGTIAGRVKIDRANWRLGIAAQDVDLPRITTREINRPNGARSARRASRTDSWRYLVNATAPSRVRVEGLGLDSEWGINIALRGTVDDPRIGGTANLVRGEYTFAGSNFDLTRGRIVFDPNGPIDPQLDIVAETSRSGTNISIAITGNAQRPAIAFSSNPPLPQEELLARLLFGGSVTTLSATDAVQLAAALTALQGGGGGIDPIGALRSSIGLDQLRIISADPIIGRETGIALGKNITRQIYVELITDGRGYSATQLEYRITNWLALLGTVSTIGRDSVLVQVRKDY